MWGGDDFEIAKEDWNDYRLTDGGRVRIKTTVQKIFRVVDSNGQPLPSPDGSGEPWMAVRHNTQVASSD